MYMFVFVFFFMKNFNTLAKSLIYYYIIILVSTLILVHTFLNFYYILEIPYYRECVIVYKNI